MLRLALNLLIYPLLARHLGPKGFGNFSYCIALISIFQISVNLGLDQITIKALISKKEDSNTILGSILGIKLIGASIGFILIMLFSYFVHFTESEIRIFTLILSISLFSMAFDTIRIWFESQVKFRYIAISSFVAFAVSASLKLLFIYLKLPLIYFILTFLIESLIIAALLITFYWLEKGRISSWNFKFTQAKSILIEAAPILLSTIAVILNMIADQIILKNFSGAAELGIYSSATKISEIWFMAIAAVIAILYPYLVDAKSKCIETYNLRFDKVFQITIIATASFAIIIFLSAHNIINILYGERFAGGDEILSIHIWTGMFVAMIATNNAWYITQSLTRFILIFSVVGLIINIVLNIILIPKFHGVGAAWASLISQMVTGYLALLFIPKTRNLFWHQTKSLLLMNTNKLFK